MSLLTVSNLTKRFGGLTALHEVALAIEPGQIRGLIGPNGSGKTTLFNVICGVFSPDNGSITFDDTELVGLPPHRVIQLGLARSFQEVQLMYDMTVLENAMVGGHKLAGSGALAALFSLPSARRDDERIRQKARESLEFVGLFDARNELARNIPYGHQRLLDVARCLTSDPALLLLDEPTAGMTMAETRNLMGLVRKIRDRGTTVLLVEHDMHVIMNVCERITVLDHGVRIAEGRPAEIQANERVIEAYLGRPDRERSVG